MKARTIAATVAAMAALALALQGCSSSGSSGDGSVSGAGKTLNILTGVDTLYPAEQKQWQQNQAARFKKDTGATLKYDTYASANEELTKIQTSVVSGQGPDVYSIGTTFTPTAYSTGAFVKLSDDDWKKVGGRDRFVQASLGISGPSKGDEIGVPFASRPFVMAYNTKLLKAAGIEKPATTWDEFAEQAKALTKGDTYGIAAGYADGFDVWKFVWAMANQAGNPIVDGKTATIDSPAMRDAYKAYFGWVTSDRVVDPASVGWNNAQALAAFASGKAAYFPMTTATSKNTLDKSAVKGDYAYALMPTVPPGATERPADGRDAASILSGDNLVVANYSSNQDLAFAYIKQVTEQKEQEDFYTTFGQLPTNQAAATALETDDSTLAPLIAAAGKSVATPFSGAWGDVQLAITNITVQSIPALKSGSISDDAIEKQLQTAQKAAESSLKRTK
ncbi:carbohydrate ABC transporter substrate-binding protein (CUT1 family) [Frondihabitans sp. PhB188]|uniref:ABC transporter substrate-binding protein n=1 Tax=Frondihabitans sp. PhB188 TaxID=2485200 RepID=UPI000F4A3FF4|nr:extracellular solute-binding protein [Frondihabitans sp. PhB188]ROQ40818.1 carbohydrate ABC transporter substrate-binding protein (CUT1 family) [Frondihabitans sp. PhB188]